VLGAAACSKVPLAPPPGTGPPPPPPGYQVVDLGTLGGRWTQPEALTDDGRVVGSSETQLGQTRGFVYESGVMHELAGSQPFFRNEAQAINPAGQVAGVEVDAHTVLIWDVVSGTPRRLDTGESAPLPTRIIGLNERGDLLVRLDDNHYDVRGMIWRDGVGLELGGLGNLRAWTYATAWNGRGQVVGSSRVRHVAPTYEVFHPFVWENGVMRDLGVLGTFACGDDPQADCGAGEAADVNGYGVVVGTSTNAAGVDRAFVWENGVMRDVAAFEGRATHAHAINDAGQIMGTFDGPDHGVFVWDNGVAHSVGSLGGNTWAYGFGENGEVVGTSATASGEQHAFVWQNGQMIDLGPGSARAINARGDIVGTSGTRGILWRRVP
jgi:probable HAF family extracellular repeat protein